MPASPARRLAAAAVDYVLVGLLAALLIVLIVTVGSVFGAAAPAAHTAAAKIIYTAGMLLALAAYPLLCLQLAETDGMRTPGKLLLGLRLHADLGGRIDPVMLLGREAIKWLPLIILGAFPQASGVALAFILILAASTLIDRPGRRALHDRAASMHVTHQPRDRTAATAVPDA